MLTKPTKKNFRDVEGQTFGRWEVIGYAGSDNGARWLCRCSCGSPPRVVPATNLFQGSRSCGCLQREAASETGKTLHLRRRKVPCATRTHGMSKSPEYRAWNQMVQRCTNEKIRNYKNYGGRGIVVCEEWKTSFDAFFRHIGPRPGPKYSLDRIDNNGHYEPGNVRWATSTQQRANTSRTRRFDYRGEMLNVAEIAKRCGISYQTLRVRLVVLGWAVEEAVTTDPKAYHNRAE